MFVTSPLVESRILVGSVMEVFVFVYKVLRPCSGAFGAFAGSVCACRPFASIEWRGFSLIGPRTEL